MSFASYLMAAAAIVFWPVFAQAANITPDEAPKHIGENATVCGTVASATYAAGSRGQPTFLNLDKPHPNEIFTVVIWGENRPKFGTPEKSLQGKKVCTTGVIQLYHRRPEVILRDPSQLTQE
jgi:hypothetical protein